MAYIVKNPAAMQETQVRSLGWEDPLEKGMETHSSTLAGESHGQRSLVGYSPWGHRESDTTEQLIYIQAAPPNYLDFKIFASIYSSNKMCFSKNAWKTFSPVAEALT